MGLIYMRISPSSGKYIGQTALQEEKRWEGHYQESCYPKRTEYNSILNKAIRKYGKDNFEVRILEDNIPQEKLNEREAFWIEKYKTYYKDGNHGYNMTRGGDGVVRYKAESFMELWNQGFSSGEIGKILKVKRDTVSLYLRQMGVSQKEIKDRGILYQRKNSWKFDPEEAYRLWNEGMGIQEIANKLSIPLYSCSTIRGALKDLYKISEEQFEKRRHEVAVKARKFSSKIKINQYDLEHNFIASWNCIHDLAREINRSPQAIYFHLKGKTNTCGGYILEREEEENDKLL